MSHLDRSKRMMEAGMEYLFGATPYIDPILSYGKGSCVWDVDGNRYLDMNAGQFCMTFGHSYKPFIDRITEQMTEIYHSNTSALSDGIFEASKLMAEINQYNVSKTLFLSTGSEANEAAIRYAKFYTGRNGVASVDKGYHGLTLASQSSTMAGKWSLPKVDGTFSVKTPVYIHSEEKVDEEIFVSDCIKELKHLFNTVGDQLSCFIIEPIIGVGGMAKIPARYLKELRKQCDEYGTVLILDECQCGFGRSGEWFAYQVDGIIPDMVTTAKAMANGLPVSGLTMRKEIAERVEGRLTHFSSHQNDSLAAACVIFVINEIKNRNLLSGNKKKGALLLDAISEVCGMTEGLSNPRGWGLMCGFDIDDTLISDYRQVSGQLREALLKNGALVQAVRQGRTFRVMPSYCITEAEIVEFKELFERSVKEIFSSK